MQQMAQMLRLPMRFDSAAKLILQNACRRFSDVPKVTDPSKIPEVGIKKMSGKLSTLHKAMLVFSKKTKYKSIKDVPDSVPVDLLERGRSRARIRLSNYLMFLTFVGCMVYAYSGKMASKRGESVSQMNLDWHKEYNEKEAAKSVK